MLCVKCDFIKELETRKSVISKLECFGLAHITGQNCPKCRMLMWLAESQQIIQQCVVCDPAAHPERFPGGVMWSGCVKCESLAFYKNHRQQVEQMACSMLAHYSPGTPCTKCSTVQELDKIISVITIVPCDPHAHLPNFSAPWHQPQQPDQPQQAQQHQEDEAGNNPLPDVDFNEEEVERLLAILHGEDEENEVIDQEPNDNGNENEEEQEEIEANGQEPNDSENEEEEEIIEVDAQEQNDSENEEEDIEVDGQELNEEQEDGEDESESEEYENDYRYVNEEHEEDDSESEESESEEGGVILMEADSTTP